jgi:hypothetical protein
MDHSQALDHFYEICRVVRTKSGDTMCTLEREILELEDFRGYLGSGGNISYFIENADAKPSRIASLFTKIGPPKLAMLARDSAKIFPDDMPKNLSERQAFIENRFEHLDDLGLSLESVGEGGYDGIDSFFCCPEEGAIFAAVNALYRRAAA